MKMRLLFLLSAFLFGSSVMHGRVGETYERLVERYGQPTEKKKDADGEYLTFLKNGIEVHCVVREKHAVAIIYNFFRDIKESEVMVLLRANGKGMTWKKEEAGAFKYSWTRSDGVLSAFVSKNRPETLMVAFDTVVRAEGRKAMKSDEKNLDEF